MIREIATSKGSTGTRGLLLIILVAIAVIVLSMVVGFVQSTFGIQRMEYIIYLGLIVLGIVLIRRYVTQYRYSLFDDEIIFERMVGKKVTPVLVLRLWEIKELKPFANISKDEADERAVQKLNVDKKNAWSILYEKDGTPGVVVFNPSEEFVHRTQKALDMPLGKEAREPDIIT